VVLAQEYRKRHQEMADLLIVKQHQLDDVGSQRQAMQMRSESEARRAQETVSQLQSQLAAVTEDLECGKMDAKPRNFQPIKQRYVPPQAANVIDQVSIFAVNLLRRFPMARLVLFTYLIFLHLMTMFIMHTAHHEIHETRSLGHGAQPGPPK